MRLIIYSIAALVVCVTIGNLLASESTTQRYDVQEALAAWADISKQATAGLSPPHAERVKKADKKWAKSITTTHADYIMRTYPFYDADRAQAIAIMNQCLLLKEIATSSTENIEKNIQLFEKNTLSDFYIVQLARIYEEEAMKRFQNNIGVVNESFLHCTYDNYDTARNIVGAIADTLLETGSDKSGVALSLGSTLNRETIDCKFRGNVKSFSTSYFYTSIITGNKFFTRDKTKQISNTEVAQGINIASNTVKSSLDYFVVRLDIEVDKQIYKDIYVFQADRVEKKLHRIETEYFLNAIATQYEFDS